MKSSTPVPTILNQKRMSITIYGAVGYCLGFPFFHYSCETTNSEDFMVFLRELRKAINDIRAVKPILVLDNHSAHKSLFYDGRIRKFHVMFQPTYSCHYNPVETVWSILKHHLRIHFARDNRIINTERVFK